MTLHRNARTCPESRELIARRVLDQGWTLAAAAAAAGVGLPTARKWVRRRARGESLEDRSSAPRRVRNRTPRDRVEAVLALRRVRLTAEQIAAELEMAPSTVSLICKREVLGRLPPLERGAPDAAMSEGARGSSSTSTSKSSGESIGSGTGSRADAPATTAPAEPAGTTSMSSSTTPPGSPTPRSSPTSTPRPRPAFCDGRSPISPRSGSPSSASSPTTATPIARPSTRSPAGSSGSATSAPAPTRRAPTARRSGSSRRSWTAGPTTPSMAQAASEPRRCRRGWTATTESVPTARLGGCRRWIVWPNSMPTTWLAPTPSHLSR
jgi:transposase-like protein